MDPRYSGQDVVRCCLCETSVDPMYCKYCHVGLCKDCTEKHVSDKSKAHEVVSLQEFCTTLQYPKCMIHSSKQCELYCEQCETPICTKCVSSKKHKHHDIADIVENYESKREDIERDLREFQNSIYPEHQEAVSTFSVLKADLRKHSQKLKSCLKKQGEIWHREINNIIFSMQSEIDDSDSKQFAVIDRQEEEINHRLKQISQIILDLKKMLNSGNMGLVSQYKSANKEFRKLPSKLIINLSNFQPQTIKKKQILKQFGSLSRLSIETKEKDETAQSEGLKSSPPDRVFLDVFYVITNIKTGHQYTQCVVRLSDEEIWTSGNNNNLQLLNLRGELLKTVQIESGNEAKSISIVHSGDLVYTSYNDSSINVVKNKQITTLVRLKGWKPSGLCGTSSGDLLVIMGSDDDKHTKVVRYSGFTETQSIQWDDKGQPLYSSGQYLSENKNLDICLSDIHANVVVVVSAAGKLRFKYTGAPNSNRDVLQPFGITTDSQGNILIADGPYHRVHIVDQDGHFLRYLKFPGFILPYDLCVDSKDNLFVANNSDQIQKIQYYK